jgi:hypothetical protein
MPSPLPSAQNFSRATLDLSNSPLDLQNESLPPFFLGLKRSYTGAAIRRPMIKGMASTKASSDLPFPLAFEPGLQDDMRRGHEPHQQDDEIERS